MEIKLSKIQIADLDHICKKGWGGYSQPREELDEMVSSGLLTINKGPFGDVVYRPTEDGRRFINSIRG